MKTLVLTPTWLCAASAVAAIDSSLVAGDELVLLVTNNSSPPEVNPSLLDQPAFRTISSRFSRVAYLNDLIYPLHPREFLDKGARSRNLKKKIKEALDLDDEFLLVAQSIHVPPTSTVLKLFPKAKLMALSDGLMSYGPTRFELGASVSSRLQGLLYLELIPGVEPVLLSEFMVPKIRVPGAAFREVVRRYAEAGESPSVKGWDALLLGQYLAALNLISADEEESLHLDMIRVAHAKGAASALFKPHPSAPPAIRTRMQALAEELGIKLDVFDGREPVELILQQTLPKLVIGCFSTGMAMAASFFGTQVVSVGTEFVAGRLPRLEDSNRIPLALVYGTYERASIDRVPVPPTIAFHEPSREVLPALVLELSHTMQPRSHTERLLHGSTSLTVEHPGLRVFFEAPKERKKRAPLKKRVMSTIRKVPAGALAVTLGRRAKRFVTDWYQVISFRP